MKSSLLTESIKNNTDRVLKEKSIGRKYQSFKKVTRHILERGPGLFISGMATLSRDPVIFDLGCSFLDVKCFGNYQEKKIKNLINMYK